MKKRLELAGLREDVAFVKEQFHLSERRDCKLVNLDRSSCRYQPRADHNAQLRQDLLSVAHQRPRYGYRRLHALLTRQGHQASPEWVYRLYQKEGLALRRIRRKRLAASVTLSRLLHQPTQEWALDFVSDSLMTGRAIRVLAVVDAFTRECLTLEVDTSLSSSRVTRSLEPVLASRGAPQVIRCDNGPELTSKHFLHWCE